MKLNSNHLFAILAAAGVTVSSFKLASALNARMSRPKTAAAMANPVDRGQYLVKLAGCTDCHTPKKLSAQGPVDDPDFYLAGHLAQTQLPPPPDLSDTPWNVATAGMTAWTGPWGITYAANLTPDENTGLGIWTEGMFRKAMRTGRHMGDGREILPPMPWQNMDLLSDEDLGAIFAYLRSIPSVKNEVPQAVPPTGSVSLE